MEQPNLRDLKYGIIYLFSDRSSSPGIHDPEAIVEKFVYPMQVEWIDEPGREDLLLIARRFNVGNIGRYATVSLTLSRMNRSGGWFEAIQHFADALMGVSDAGDGDIVLNESDYGYLYGGHTSIYDTLPQAAPQDNTRVESAGRRLVNKATNWLKKSVTRVDAENVAEAPSRAKREPDPLQEEEALEVKLVAQTTGDGGINGTLILEEAQSLIFLEVHTLVRDVASLVIYQRQTVAVKTCEGNREDSTVRIVNEGETATSYQVDDTRT